MGFSNTMLSTFKKLSCISQPPVEETSNLPADQRDEMMAVDVTDHQIKGTEEEKEDSTKQKTIDVSSEPKDKEEPKTEASTDTYEPKDEDQTNDQEHKTQTTAEVDFKSEASALPSVAKEKVDVQPKDKGKEEEEHKNVEVNYAAMKGTTD